jgi:hypothetical protein
LLEVVFSVKGFPGKCVTPGHDLKVNSPETSRLTGGNRSSEVNTAALIAYESLRTSSAKLIKTGILKQALTQTMNAEDGSNTFFRNVGIRL